MKDTFIVIPDSKQIQINPRIHEKEIVVSPCGVEHWISTDLFKFRIYAEREQLHVIGICSANQVPLYSLFCDEIVLVEANQTWYEDSCSTGNGNHVVQSHIDIEIGNFRNKFAAAISDAEVIEQFSYRKVYFLESAYNKFIEVKSELPFDVIIVEFKIGFTNSVLRLHEHIPAIGANHNFQRELVKRIGADNYLTTQIMASAFLNWQFLCCGGSSNLLCVVPVKTISIRDPTINESTIQIVRGFSKKRYGFGHIPYINKVYNINNINTKRCNRVISVRGPQDDVEEIKFAFKALSQFKIDPEISICRVST